MSPMRPAQLELGLDLRAARAENPAAPSAARPEDLSTDPRLALLAGTSDRRLRVSPDFRGADWAKRTRDYWISVTEPEELADLMGEKCRTREELDRFMRLPGVRLASDAHLLREAAEILRERRGW